MVTSHFNIENRLTAQLTPLSPTCAKHHTKLLPCGIGWPKPCRDSRCPQPNSRDGQPAKLVKLATSTSTTQRPQAVRTWLGRLRSIVRPAKTVANAAPALPTRIHTAWQLQACRAFPRPPTHHSVSRVSIVPGVNDGSSLSQGADHLVFFLPLTSSLHTPPAQ